MKVGFPVTALLLALAVGAAPRPASAGSASDVMFDPASIWTLQDENSSITTQKLTDRYYNNGLRFGWTSPTDDVPDFLGNAFRGILGESGRQRLAVSVQQSIFTPTDTWVTVPDPKDRPYAGVLVANASILQDTNTTRSVFGVQAGVVGPAAGAEQVQNGFHDLIGYRHTVGWAYQIANRPVAEVLAEREWRYPIGRFGPLEADSVSTLEGAAGNLRVYGLAGSILRIGQGLNSDFGPSRVRPGLTGTDAYTQTVPFAWYIFAGADGQAVAYDITIDGDTQKRPNQAVRTPFVGEFEGGLTILYDGWRISYAQVAQTNEIHHQQGGLHEFGSLSVSAHF